MLKRYRMPNGRTYQFADKDVQTGAVPVEEVQAKKKDPANKARKAVKKK